MTKQEYFAAVHELCQSLRSVGFRWTRTYSEKRQSAFSRTTYRTKLYIVKDADRDIMIHRINHSEWSDRLVASQYDSPSPQHGLLPSVVIRPCEIVE